MSVATNKDLVRRFYASVINGRALSAVDTLLSPDFTHDDVRRGIEGQRAAVAVFLDGFSNLHNEIVLILGEDDLVAAHQRWTGTHDGPFLGVAASGRAVDFSSTAVLRIAGGRITAAWDEVDLATLMRQIGASPPA